MTTTRGSQDRVGAGAYAVVAVLVLASVLSFLDRAILGLMVDPIRRELHVGDAQIGLLSGFAFALFYAFLGLPFGRWADKNNRTLLIVGGVLTWSLATAAGAFTRGFPSLFVTRMLVGVGEATLGPAALSLVANIFPKHRIGFTLGLLATGITLGNGVAVVFGGLLVQWSEAALFNFPVIGNIGGWRLVFIVVGACGLPVAALIGLVVREPSRHEAAAAPTLPQLFRQIRQQSSAYGLITAGYSLMVVMSFAQFMWGPTYFLRIHHMSVSGFGQFYGVVMGLGGTAGLLAGGAWSDAWTRRGITAAPARVNLISIVLQLPFLLIAYLARDVRLALPGFAVGIVIMCFNGGLQSATLQRITPHRMLGSITSIYLICANLVGAGAGPFVIGALSQHLAPSGADLGQALALTGLVSLPLAALFVVLALKPLARSERLMASLVEVNPGAAFDTIAAGVP